MPGRDKLYVFKDCMDRCEQDATRCQDFPDDRVSQRVDPLPPLSGAKDAGLEGPATAAKSKPIAQLRAAHQELPRLQQGLQGQGRYVGSV